MISEKTQHKLDRAAKGLPDENLSEDDRLLQEEADALGITVEDLIKINDDFDDVDEDAANTRFQESQYEVQRERDN